jgi:hypothetical protein
MFRVDISKKMKFYLKKKHKQFQDYREKMLPKLLKCILSLLIGIVIGELATEHLTGTRESTITNVAVVEAKAETLAPVVSADKTNKIVESVDDSALSVSEIENLIRKEFPDCPETAVKIARCESSLDYTREGDKHLTFEYKGQRYGSSFGLFQIRSGGNDRGGIWVRSDNVEEFATNMLDVKKNIKMAREIYEASGNNFGKWTCSKLI